MIIESWHHSELGTSTSASYMSQSWRGLESELLPQIAEFSVTMLLLILLLLFQLLIVFLRNYNLHSYKVFSDRKETKNSLLNI